VSDPLKIAVGYLRCSTDRQDDSIDQQRKCLLDWSEENNFKIIHWYEDEGKSGTSFEKRPGFMKLSRTVESNPEFRYVLVYDESRWGRASNPRESNYWKMHFERLGVKVIIISSRSQSKNDIGDYVIEVVESAEASEYSKKLSRAVLRGSKSNTQKGYSSGGFAPYGYRRQAIHKTSSAKRILETGQHAIYKEEKVTLVLGDPLEVGTVKRIFRMKATSHGYKKIASTLNKEKIPCPQRGRWGSEDRKWSCSTIRGIIKNRAYCGDRVYNVHPQSHLRYSDGKDAWINPKDKWIVAENVHPPIIDRKLFSQANQTSGYKGGARHTFESPYLLSGLIKCDHCGFNFTGATYKKNDLSYYIDGGYNSKGKSVCTSLKIPKDEIEDYAVKSIKDSIGQSDIPKIVKRVVEKKLSGRSLKGTDKYSAILSTMQEDERKKANLISAIEKGINMDVVIQRLTKLDNRLNLLYQEKERLESVLVRGSDIERLVKMIDALVDDFDRLFYSATTLEKKRFLALFIEQIVIRKQAQKAQFFIRKIPAVNDNLRREVFTVSSVAVGGLALDGKDYDDPKYYLRTLKIVH